MEHEYKSHSILIRTWPSLNPDGYRPEVRITNHSPIDYKSLKSSLTFPTKEEAEAHGFDIAKQWIDAQIKTPDGHG